jgi:hypothetical protein
MAGRLDYVRITREEFEDWLNSLPWKWSRKQSRQGIYYVHFSRNVGCAVSATIGRDDNAVGRARGSMSLTLVSLVTGETLNRKDKDRKHFQRTKNWRVTWADGIKHWLGVYQSNAGFYEKIAPVSRADRENAGKEMQKRIEAIPDWDKDRMLASFHEQASRGSLLSDKQIAIIERAEQPPQRAPAAPPPAAGRGDDPILNKLRLLYSAARRAGDDWTMQFAQSLGEQIKRGRNLSPKQVSLMDDKFHRYRIASIQRLAATYLARS